MRRPGFLVLILTCLLNVQESRAGVILVTSRTDTVGVFSVNVDTGVRTVLSSESPNPDVGTGDPFDDPRGIVVDSSAQFAYVAEFDLGSIIQVDLSNGNRTEFSGSSRGTGDDLVNPVGIAFESSGNLIVADNDVNALFRIDINNGNRTIISKPGSVGTGTGGDSEFSNINGIAIDSSGNILIADESRAAIIKVDPTTGNRSVFSNDSSGVGTGPNLVRPQSLTIDSSGNVFVADESDGTSAADGQVFRIDPANGNRTVIASNSIGSGDAFNGGANSGPKGIAFDSDGNLLVTSNANDSIYKLVPTIDPNVFNRDIITGGTSGSGIALGDLTTGATQLGAAQTPIPEPSSLVLLASAMSFYLIRSRRRRDRH